MMKTSTGSFARRARLSTAAIAAAVVLTLAALVAVIVAAGETALTGTGDRGTLAESDSSSVRH